MVCPRNKNDTIQKFNPVGHQTIPNLLHRFFLIITLRELLRKEFTLILTNISQSTCQCHEDSHDVFVRMFYLIDVVNLLPSFPGNIIIYVTRFMASKINSRVQSTCYLINNMKILF